MDVRYVELPDGYKKRMQILHAVGAPIETITVSDICDAVSISRQTFYKYFESKYDISYWYAFYCDDVTLSEIGRTLTCYEGLHGFFSLLKREQLFFSYSVRNGQPDNNQRGADRRRQEVLTKTLIEYRHQSLTTEMDFYIHAFADLLHRSLRSWFASNMERSPEELARLLENCIPRPLYAALEGLT